VTVRELMEMLEGFDDSSEVCVEATFPELGGWGVKSYSINLGPDTDSDGPRFNLSVHGADFDYPGVMPLIERAAASILARKEA
jgi:hypothetical protein